MRARLADGLGTRLACKHVHVLTTGVGKSHYIRQQLMRSSRSVTIAVNEGFEPLKTIQRLHSLPKHQRSCAIYFNFNLVPPIGVSMQHYCNYLVIFFYWFCTLCRILFIKKTRRAMTLSWKLSAGFSLTSCFLDMWKTPTLENPSNCLEAFPGQFISRLV